VFVNEHALEKLISISVLYVVAADHAALDGFSVRFDRRNANDLPYLQTAIGFDAAAINTNLTRAQKLLQRTKSQTRIMDLEPSINAHTVFVGIDGDMFYSSHSVVQSLYLKYCLSDNLLIVRS